MKEYFDSLKLEIVDKAKKYDEIVTSVYFGGGTPTYPPFYYVCDALKVVKDNFRLSNNAEITIEGNPKTFDDVAVASYKDAGFNRFSVGVQSFNDDELKKIGRIHNKDEAKNAIKIVSKYFDNYSIDLMIGLQNQTFDSVAKTLDTALSLKAKHISCYTLMVEEGTPLYYEVANNKYVPPSEEKTADLYKYMASRLEKEGYIQYEISNFGQKGYYSNHNLGYWNMTNYLGFGVNAHSLYNNARFYNSSDLKEYILNPKSSILEEILTESDFEKEYIMLSLRTIFGVNLEYFSNKFSKNFIDTYYKQIEKLKKFLDIDLKHVAIKQEFFLVSNSIIVEFM